MGGAAFFDTKVRLNLFSPWGYHTLFSPSFMGQSVMNHMTTGGEHMMVRTGRVGVSVWGHESHTHTSSHPSQGPSTLGLPLVAPGGFFGHESGWKCFDEGAGRVSPAQGVASGPDDKSDGQSLVLDRSALNPHCPLCAANRLRVDNTERARSRLRRFPQPTAVSTRPRPSRLHFLSQSPLPLLGSPARLGDPSGLQSAASTPQLQPAW